MEESKETPKRRRSLLRSPWKLFGISAAVLVVLIATFLAGGVISQKPTLPVIQPAVEKQPSQQVPPVISDEVPAEDMPQQLPTALPESGRLRSAPQAMAPRRGAPVEITLIRVEEDEALPEDENWFRLVKYPVPYYKVRYIPLLGTRISKRKIAREGVDYRLQVGGPALDQFDPWAEQLFAFLEYTNGLSQRTYFRSPVTWQESFAAGFGWGSLPQRYISLIAGYKYYPIKVHIVRYEDYEPKVLATFKLVPNGTI